MYRCKDNDISCKWQQSVKKVIRFIRRKSNGHYKNVIVLCYILPPLLGLSVLLSQNNRKSDRLNEIILILQHLIKIERRNRNNDAMLSTYSHIDVYHDWDTGDNGDDP